MTLRKFTIGLAGLLTLTLSASAIAADTTTTQSEIRTALDALNLNVDSEKITFAKRGRKDLLLTSANNYAGVVADLKQAYVANRVLPNGYKVVGWAHIRATNNYTFTLKKGTDTFVTEVSKAPTGTKLKVWGAAYKYRPNRKPLSTIPRRYVPISSTTIVR